MLSHQLETKVAVEEQSNTGLEQLLDQYGEDAWKQIYDYDSQGDKYVNKATKIVLHHTADETCDPAAISRYHSTNTKNGTQGMNTSKMKIGEFNSEVRYHYIIQADGKVDNVRYEDEVGRGTRTNNIDVIHIAFCGNFNQHEPSKEQYMEGGKLIGQIRSKYGELPAFGHSQLEGESTACPGKLFDYDKLSFYEPMGRKVEEKTASQIIKDAGYVLSTPVVDNPMIECRQKEGMKCLGRFDKITAYYSPQPSQKRYFAPDRKKQRTYQQELAINGDLTPANGMLYLEDHKFTHGACGYSMLGKKLWIEGRSEEHGVFTCVDRGSGIGERDIDIRYGIGQEALNRIDGGDDAVKMVRHPLSATVYAVN